MSSSIRDLPGETSALGLVLCCLSMMFDRGIPHIPLGVVSKEESSVFLGRRICFW